MQLTLDVLKFDISIDFNEMQPSNREVILLIKEVFTFVKFTYSKFSQFINIPLKDSYSEVSIFERSTSTIFSKF